jgi:hypothetical protein
MLQLFETGDRIYGYCNGYFGRDDYANKICVMVRPKYAVFEHVDLGTATVLDYDDRLTAETVDRWREAGEQNDGPF